MLNKFIVRVFFLVFLCSCAFKSKAQKVTIFIEDSVKFIKELDIYFQDYSTNKEEAAQFVKDFSKFWADTVFINKYKDYVYITCNKMLLKKMRPYPNNFANL